MARVPRRNFVADARGNKGVAEDDDVNDDVNDEVNNEAVYRGCRCMAHVRRTIILSTVVATWRGCSSSPTDQQHCVAVQSLLSTFRDIQHPGLSGGNQKLAFSESVTKHADQ